MKELSQIRMAVLDALRGAGIQAMEVFPEKQAMAYSGVVAAVGVGAASGKTAGFCHYLGEMKDPETQAVRERADLVNNYRFSRDDIDGSDYLYIYDREGKPIGDGAYSKYDYYNVYFFDSQTTTLYYFHNNI